MLQQKLRNFKKKTEVLLAFKLRICNLLLQTHNETITLINNKYKQCSIIVVRTTLEFQSWYINSNGDFHGLFSYRH